MAATKGTRRKASLDKSVDQFCQGVEGILTQIYDRIATNPTGKKKRGRKKKE
ncbi:MAG: hypothetical protein JSV11_01360 [Nitrospiraceae bacterium]|nr:MAG: hypothetical protein JSV11_01360 [Nitrospiraceae bacterium]